MGLSFGRLYLMKGLNLMITNPPILVKIVDFSMKTADFVDFEKLQILENREIHKNFGFLCETKDQVCLVCPYSLYLKMNSIFYGDLSIIHFQLQKTLKMTSWVQRKKSFWTIIVVKYVNQ